MDAVEAQIAAALVGIVVTMAWRLLDKYLPDPLHPTPLPPPGGVTPAPPVPPPPSHPT